MEFYSSPYMLESIAEQKMELAAYAAECSDIPQLSAHQLSIIDKVIKLLRSIKDITQTISSDNASASLVIPYVRVLHKTWETIDDDCGVQTMKEEMLSSLNRRFSDVESKESLVLAMLLDPRFKDKFFCGIVERAHAKTLLETKLSETRTTTTSLSTDPPEKHARKDVMKVFDEIINEASADVSVVSGNALVDTYLAEPFTSYQSGNAYAWWKENRS